MTGLEPAVSGVTDQHTTWIDSALPMERTKGGGSVLLRNSDAQPQNCDRTSTYFIDPCHLVEPSMMKSNAAHHARPIPAISPRQPIDSPRGHCRKESGLGGM